MSCRQCDPPLMKERRCVFCITPGSAVSGRMRNHDDGESCGGRTERSGLRCAPQLLASIMPAAQRNIQQNKKTQSSVFRGAAFSRGIDGKKKESYTEISMIIREEKPMNHDLLVIGSTCVDVIILSLIHICESSAAAAAGGLSVSKLCAVSQYDGASEYSGWSA